MTTDRQVLGERLREAREYAGLSQQEAAAATGVSRTAVSLIESGQRKVDVLEIRRFSEAYQCSISDLTGDAQEAGPPEAVRFLARTAAGLGAEDQEQLLKFARFLASKKKED